MKVLVKTRLQLMQQYEEDTFTPRDWSKHGWGLRNSATLEKRPAARLVALY